MGLYEKWVDNRNEMIDREFDDEQKKIVILATIAESLTVIADEIVKANKKNK